MSFLKKSENDNNSKIAYIDEDINKNITYIKNQLGDSSDLCINIFKSDDSAVQYASIYINVLVDKQIINHISEELTKMLKVDNKYENKVRDKYFSELINNIRGIRKYEVGCDYDMIFNNLLSGNTIFLVDGCNRFFAVDTLIVEGRVVGEPTSQNVLKGPKEAFTEKINVNISLIRKRIKNRALRVEDITLGSVTNTKVTLMYINGIAKEEIVNEIRTRISKIQIDAVLDSEYIEELIKDDRYTIFPTFFSSERPDTVAGGILEGKVAILVDGTAYVLTAPALFIEFFQSSEDYYHNYVVSSMIRMLRYVGFFLTLIVPSSYVSLVTFHQEMIPAPLLVSIAAQREGVPFPALVEALLMEGVFEILREAGIRMPKAIGPAISIVGALVLGQAAVEAGIVSSVMVIVVSITAISSFAVPSYAMSNAMRVMRFGLMLMAGMFGFYGVFMTLILIVLHLCKLKSIGVPYLAPIAPKIKGENKDTIFRFPLWKMKHRPIEISNANTEKLKEKSPVSHKKKEKPELR